MSIRTLGFTLLALSAVMHIVSLVADLIEAGREPRIRLDTTSGGSGRSHPSISWRLVCIPTDITK